VSVSVESRNYKVAELSGGLKSECMRIGALKMTEGYASAGVFPSPCGRKNLGNFAYEVLQSGAYLCFLQAVLERCSVTVPLFMHRMG